jgi:hypothetical protein
MATPSKPIALLKKHVSKKETARRAAAEKELLTGKTMQCSAQVRADKVALAHWKRIQELLGKAGKNDALLENVLNRYCIMQSELEQSARELEAFRGAMQELVDRRDEMDFLTFLTKTQAQAGLIMAADKLINTKRKMLLDIEDKNALTMASQLRSIAKKPTEAVDPDEQRMNELASRRRMEM